MEIQSAPSLSQFLPEHSAKRFESPNKCIYCGNIDGLSDEHIIPFGLGGKWVLEKSSCKRCAEKTSAFEHTCQRTMYGPLRLMYDLPTRRKKKRPSKLKLKVKFSAEQEEWDLIDIDQNKYPFLLTFPHFEAPGILSDKPLVESCGPVTRKLWIRGASPKYEFKKLMNDLLLDLKAHALFPESKADIPSFCKMIAKIAHSFAYAKFGDTLNWYLPQYIIGNGMDHCMHYIGSCNNSEPPTNNLHNLDVVNFSNSQAIIVRIRLLSKLGTPSYFVAVGDKK